jgi:diguanylate cyclase (GGDEF)-like protein/PAS domain S-box-containing protein
MQPQDMSLLEGAFVQAPIGMALVDMAGRILRVNDALCRITGYTAGQVCGRGFRDLSGPHATDAEASQKRELLDGHITTYQVETQYRHALGHPVDVLVSVSLVRDDSGQPVHLIAQVQDISERKTVEAQLEHLVGHDYLTGLFNARRFHEALAQETKWAARYRRGGAVLLLDLDHFKEVNDRRGHQAGDDLLKVVAVALQSRARDTDILARLGGDEFGIILPQVDAAQAQVVADGIMEALRHHVTSLPDDQIAATASIGVALYDGLTNVDMLAAADHAMYVAKRNGGNQWSLYRPPGDGRHTSSGAIEASGVSVSGRTVRPHSRDRLSNLAVVEGTPAAQGASESS